jgi:oligopeptide transport system ATP-binding protein
MAIGRAIEEPLLSHRLLGKKEARQRAKELLDFMGISPTHYFRYPHEFSGGQRQRIVIARALALNPRFLVADEPLSALDVSIQAQILHVLEEIKERFRITYLFISHDLAVVRHISDRVAVMYLGRIVELAETESLYQDPLHPYTRALLDAVPVSHPALRRKRTLIPGEVPSPLNPPTGCPFHPRCGLRMARCSRDAPALMEPHPGHEVACFVYGDLSIQTPMERRRP